jgi:hypothetical protein
MKEGLVYTGTAQKTWIAETRDEVDCHARRGGRIMEGHFADAA